MVLAPDGSWVYAGTTPWTVYGQWSPYDGQGALVVTSTVGPANGPLGYDSIPLSGALKGWYVDQMDACWHYGAYPDYWPQGATWRHYLPPAYGTPADGGAYVTTDGYLLQSYVWTPESWSDYPHYAQRVDDPFWAGAAIPDGRSYEASWPWAPPGRTPASMATWVGDHVIPGTIHAAPPSMPSTYIIPWSQLPAFTAQSMPYWVYQQAWPGGEGAGYAGDHGLDNWYDSQSWYPGPIVYEVGYGLRRLYQRLYSVWQSLWYLGKALVEAFYSALACVEGYASRISHVAWTMATCLPYVWGWRLVDVIAALAAGTVSKLSGWLPHLTVARIVQSSPILDAANYLLPVQEVIAWLQVCAAGYLGMLLWRALLRWCGFAR